MPIEYKKNQAVFSGMVTVDDAEALLEWLQTKSSVKVNLSACTHLHAANVQVLMAAKTPVAEWPVDTLLRALLETALTSVKGKLNG